MADSRNANKPDKPDKNEVWSWVVIALLFAFAWPVGLIVLLAKLSDGKRKRPSSGAQPTIITAETENTVKSVAAAEKTSDSAAGQTKKNKSNITRRTPKVSDSGAKVLRIIGIIVTIIGAIALSGSLKENLFFLQDGHWAWFLEEIFFPMGLTAGGLGLLLGSHWMRRRLRRYAKYQTIAGRIGKIQIQRCMLNGVDLLAGIDHKIICRHLADLITSRIQKRLVFHKKFQTVHSFNLCQRLHKRKSAQNFLNRIHRVIGIIKIHLQITVILQGRFQHLDSLRDRLNIVHIPGIC